MEGRKQMKTGTEIEECIEMLNILRKSAWRFERGGESSTRLHGITLESFRFAIDKAINLLKENKE